MSARHNQEFDRPDRRLVAQKFEGVSQISAGALEAATGLTPGDTLLPDKVNTARRAILDLCVQRFPGQTPSLKCRMQTTIEGDVTLTWIITEPG